MINDYLIFLNSVAIKTIASMSTLRLYSTIKVNNVSHIMSPLKINFEKLTYRHKQSSLDL